MQNDSIFREKVETTSENQANNSLPKPTIEEVGKPLHPEDKIGNEDDFEDLALWEGEKNKKYVNEYFNTHNIAHEFMWKMPLAQIDKYIREEMDSREYEKTKTNYRDILNEIESEIGSEKLQLQKRLQKIAQYIQVSRKYRAIREKKESFRQSLSSPSL